MNKEYVLKECLTGVCGLRWKYIFPDISFVQVLAQRRYVLKECLSILKAQTPVKCYHTKRPMCVTHIDTCFGLEPGPSFRYCSTPINHIVIHKANLSTCYNNIISNNLLLISSANVYAD